jgi:hypothetical protein
VQNNPNYSKYASLVEPAIKALVQSVDVNYYATPVFTATGNKAFEVSAKVPDVAEYCDMANMALKVMGKTKTDLVNKINSMKSGDGGIKDRVLEIAAQCASRIDNPDQLWDYMTSKVCDVVKNHPNVLPERINNLILNNLKNVKYGTTYCLTQEDKYATFDFQEASEAASNEAAKWVLEPFDPKLPRATALRPTTPTSTSLPSSTTAPRRWTAPRSTIAGTTPRATTTSTPQWPTRPTVPPRPTRP